jgi:transcriptional regulator with XRE-family HTH domain
MPRPAHPDPLVTTLRTNRVATGTTQATHAHIAGVDRTSHTGWETGRFQPPLHRLRAWAAALGYDLVLSRHPTGRTFPTR